MNGQLYKKVGRKYVPIGYSDGYYGFPMEGIWVVYKGDGMTTSSCIARTGSFKPLDYELLANLIKEKRDSCLQIANELSNKSITSYEMITAIFEEICKKDK